MPSSGPAHPNWSSICPNTLGRSRSASGPTARQWRSRCRRGERGRRARLLRHSQIHASAETIARLHSLGGWATVAQRRKRLAAQLEMERARLKAVISEVPVGVVLAEAPSGRVVSVNRKAVELWGEPTNPPLAIADYNEFKVFHPDGEPYRTDQRPLARAILKGEVVEGEEAQIERADGSRSIVRVNSAPIRDSRGVVSAGVAAIVDITDERKREERARFLDDISRQLAATLDYDATIQAALQLLVPRMADAASVHHREGAILVRRWDTSGTDAIFDRKFRELARDYPLELPSAHPVAVAVRTGKSQLHEVVDAELLKTIARTEPELQRLLDLGIRSAMTLPLTVRGKTIGAMQFVAIRENRRYSLSDLALAEEVARRVALAIDNTRLFSIVNTNARESRFLSDAAFAVSGSLESDDVLRRVTSLAVPLLADFTLAYLRDEDGQARLVASAHKDTTKAATLAEAAARYRPDPDNPGCTVVRAFMTGQPVVIAEVTPETLVAEGFDAKTRETLSALAPSSWMAIPLVARDETLGAMVFVSADTNRRYGARELRVAQALASRAALATRKRALVSERARRARHARRGAGDRVSRPSKPASYHRHERTGHDGRRGRRIAAPTASRDHRQGEGSDGSADQGSCRCGTHQERKGPRDGDSPRGHAAPRRGGVPAVRRVGS